MVANERSCYELLATTYRLEKVSSAIGRAPVSKTGGWGFETLLTCHLQPTLETAQHSGPMMSTIEQVKTTGAGEGGGSWLSNTRTFFTEVRNEMRRVTWPSRREVYATTVVVILTSAFFGLYLWGLDLAIDKAIRGIFAFFGAR